MKPGRGIARLLLSVTAVALCSDCANSKSTASATSPGKLFAVKAEAAPFYYHGPAQGGGPEKMISRDTLVRMIRTSFGYCKVQLLTGEEGYMANDDLAAASPALIAANASPAKVTTAASARTEFPEPDSSSVPLAPLPDFEPTPIPTPSNLSN